MAWRMPAFSARRDGKLVRNCQSSRLLPSFQTVPTSTATVTRVAQWLRHGTGGYRIALDRVPK